MQTPPRDILTACDMAELKPEDLLQWRLTPTTIVLINTHGQKFTVIQAELPDPKPAPAAKKPARSARKPTTARKS